MLHPPFHQFPFPLAYQILVLKPHYLILQLTFDFGAADAGGEMVVYEDFLKPLSHLSIYLNQLFLKMTHML